MFLETTADAGLNINFSRLNAAIVALQAQAGASAPLMQRSALVSQVLCPTGVETKIFDLSQIAVVQGGVVLFLIAIRGALAAGSGLGNGRIRVYDGLGQQRSNTNCAYTLGGDLVQVTTSYLEFPQASGLQNYEVRYNPFGHDFDLTNAAGEVTFLSWPVRGQT